FWITLGNLRRGRLESANQEDQRQNDCENFSRATQVTTSVHVSTSGCFTRRSIRLCESNDHCEICVFSGGYFYVFAGTDRFPGWENREGVSQARDKEARSAEM